MNNSELLGAFVTVVSPGEFANGVLGEARLGRDGIGKLVGLNGHAASVEYFVSPAGPKHERRTIDLLELRPLKLWPQTPVFWFDERTDAWRRGRITASEGEGVSPRDDLYRVRFPNNEEGLIPGTKLHVRWAHPIGDPAEYLAARVTDTPYFFEGRRRIVSWLASQRAAFGGLTGLASASVDLLPHQVAIARRILADPVQRYLLADEVGLGKTIEACTVVRQHLIDDPDARVVIVVPDHLVRQWKRELTLRFGIIDTDSRVSVVPEFEVASGSFTGPVPTLVVVDEAHRSASGAFPSGDRGMAALFSGLKELASAASRVLLLSGTPVLHQEDGFLAMLHLLDPSAYPLEDREGFRERIRNRSAVADAAAQLTDDAGAIFLEDAVTQLEDAFGEDLRLRELTCEVARLAEAGESDPDRVAAIRTLRLHVTETYKLHRRLLRTRRDDPSVEHLLAVRRGLEKLQCDDAVRRLAWDLLEEWRSALPLDEDGRPPSASATVFADLVEAAFSHPSELARCLRARHEALSGTRRYGAGVGQPTFADEPSWCDRAATALVVASEAEPRATALAEWLEDTGSRAIVFVDAPEVARKVTAKLRQRLGETKVLQVGESGTDGRELADSVERFVAETGVQVLVGDRRAEEGLNLQGARAVLVHYDLPLAPTRIEQRNGRIDRLDATGRPRFLAFEGVSPYEDRWIAFLEDRVRLFHRTVAPLQYLLAESCQRIRQHLVSEGAHAFAEEAIRLEGPGGLEEELRLIQNQEALDSMGLDSEEDSAFFTQMCESDESASNEDGVDCEAWLCRRLGFYRTGIRSGIRAPDFHYVYSLGAQPLMPLHAVVTNLGQSIDPSESGRGVLRFGEFTFDRERAVGKDGIRLLRPGSPFLDAVEELVRCDDRGAAFALWRHDSSLLPGEAHLFFRVEFVVEADVEAARAVVLEAHGAPAALRRLADSSFPPISRTVWVDVEGKPITSESLLARLDLEYEKPRDTNLRPDRWLDADAACPVHDWRGLCATVRDGALAALWDEPTERTRAAGVRRFEEKAAARRVQWQSRIARIPSGPARAAEEQAARYTNRLDGCLLRGLREPRVRLDSIGVVYLSGTQLRPAQR